MLLSATLLSAHVLPQPHTGARVREEQEEEKLSSFVWIPCPSCGKAVRLSETVRTPNGVRICAECSG